MIMSRAVPCSPVVLALFPAPRSSVEPLLDTRVTDTDIVIGMMTDLSGVTPFKAPMRTMPCE